MICPHCRKPIQWEMSAECLIRARQLRKEGYSFRDMEKVLSVEGFRVSFSNLSRRLRKASK